MTNFFVAIDSACVPVELAPIVVAAKGKGAGSLTSCDRSNDPHAIPIQRQVGEISQFDLYWGFQHGLPGYNPANPPNRTTHARFNDGVAYPEYADGASLPAEYTGMDWGDGQQAVDALRSLGIPSHKTYASMGSSEQQHANLTHRITGPRWLRATRALIDRLAPKPKPLHHGDGGNGHPVQALAVRNMARKLHTLGYYGIKPWSPPSFFTQGLVKALTNFQRVYRLPPTGVLDERTNKTLIAAWTWHKRFNPDGNIKTKGK